MSRATMAVLTAKEYSLAALHLQQAISDIALATHYAGGDEGLRRAIIMVGNFVSNLRRHTLDLKTEAESLPFKPPAVIGSTT